jgi:nitronate monooxygenase
MAVERYKQMLVDSRLDDVMLTRAFTGLDTNMLRPSVVNAGLDPLALAGPVTPERAQELFGAHAKDAGGPKRWIDIWSAGHTVSGVHAVQPVASLVDQLAAEFSQARQATAALLVP